MFTMDRIQNLAIHHVSSFRHTRDEWMDGPKMQPFPECVKMDLKLTQIMVSFCLC